MNDLHNRTSQFYYKFSRFCGDLYPNRYNLETCERLARQSLEIERLRTRKQSIIVAHNYLYPEFHEIADRVGDSLGLSRYIAETRPPRVDFQSVYFMAATAKIIAGNATHVFVSDTPHVLGCSLVFGTDYEWVENWKKENPRGILVTYINSDTYIKSLSDFIGTSRNTADIIAYAAEHHPKAKILVLPDKFLGRVMKTKAIETLREKGVKIDPNRIEIYDYAKAPFHAACHVHEKLGNDALDVALIEHPNAELLIHPECGCASYCMLQVEEGKIPHAKAFFLSTEGMVRHARESGCNKFIVSTEKGMVYRLRKELPMKEFIPISASAECEYMKANTFEKLIDSLQNDRHEIVLCNDCCDPKKPHEDNRVIHIQKTIAAKAKTAIDRMLSIT